MTKPPKLYPNHQHQWAMSLLGSAMVVCTVCGLQMPRNAAGLDGQMSPPTRADGCPCGNTAEHGPHEEG